MFVALKTEIKPTYIVDMCKKNTIFALNFKIRVEMEMTAKELAALVNGTVYGNENIKINSFGKIEDASEGSITFLANPKYTQYIYSTKASVVLVSNEFVPEQEISVTLIKVADPYATLASLMQMVSASKETLKGIEQPSYVSEGVDISDDVYIGAFAYIGKGVKIGSNVKIYPQSYIGNNVEIGDNTIIYSGVKIYADCKVGNNCIIHSGAVIGADGFGFAPVNGRYEKIPQIGNVVIEDNTEIGANTTIDRATMGSTRIGKGTKLDNLIQVAHNVDIGENNVFAAQTGIAGSTQIGNYNMVGGQVGFAGHIKVGSYNEIGAQSGIPNNVGDKNRLLGYPAVDARVFAKNLVYIKKLETLFKNKK